MSTLEYIQLRDDLLKKLIDTKDVNLLQKIKDIFNNNEEEDFFDELPKEVQDLILQSNEDIKEGRLIPHEDVMKRFGR
jgi:hypothetical protein